MSDAVIEFPLAKARIRAAAAADRRVTGAFDPLRDAYRQEGPLMPERRIAALEQLDQALAKYAHSLCEAVSQDFGHRSTHETMMADLFTTRLAIRHAAKHLRRWMRPRRRPVDLLFRLGRARVEYQALGVVGIIAPWNYPVQLALSPLAAAVAAGNRVLLKPSEQTPRTAALLELLLAEVFKPSEVAVLTGGADLAHAVTHLPFDHLLFTGSTHIGRQVMRAASENLVPVTLELGGKSPVLLTDDYLLDQAVDRILAGKLLNAGQTCIAPDYVLLPRGREAAFIDAFAQSLSRRYPTLGRNPDYTAIISDGHYQRLNGLLDDARRRGARLFPLSPAAEILDPADRKLAPVLLTEVPEPADILNQEIFGPLLPLVPYDTLDGAIDYINARSRPLALYLFSHNKALTRHVLDRTLSGGVTVNDTLLHVAQEALPFGGVGESGMGAYHGEAGFHRFSHARAIFTQSRFSLTGLMRPPYGERIDRLLKWLMR
ncbi:coniferyl aldehyde dehydrogenase [Niveispirillum irakense]|uniref:coniferyl aldehyde dehydrogenase n=1 Tax=Niveispirillum irakense TaxID=34011 RepID=UPI000429E782|nr:coniferyl aldehyde dehydrogenase [Niveispirillum irakense]